MVRLKKISTLFFASCVLVCIFILYVVTDLGFKLPSAKPLHEFDDSKWSNFEQKLKHIEREITQHHAVVGEIKTAVRNYVEHTSGKGNINNQQKYQDMNIIDQRRDVNMVDEIKSDRQREFNWPVNEIKSKLVDMGNCSIMKHRNPKTDIQMMSMYDRISFEDKDGGVWKQGWRLEYEQSQWSRKNKLKVFIVPHSHNDPGWIKTFEEYYKAQTKAIFNNMAEKLGEDSRRKFIWAEISYLSLWWNSDATANEKQQFQKYLKNGQLEIVTGGWVMNDEANSHWLSIVQQLTTGHQWLIDNLGIIPKNSWAIDPFGHSSTQPYLLKLAGFQNSLIQRVHYRVKKELAQNRQLEFKWRQLWDGVGSTDMFTHMMPFYSYDVPHTCGPDPKICCQFDFKRLPGNGVTCPWGVPPRKITPKNIDERAFTILDQWRKKAQLYRSNVVLIPLGDDFRYDRANEWDHQYQNYELLIDYINAKDEWNAEVQFGTLQDYFNQLHKELEISEFPVLSGDFFTYADRNQHYWSGYYTSRPFYKNMDRVLLAYVRAAEMIVATAYANEAVSEIQSIQLRDRVEPARRWLSLFQHHDGVTGTSRDAVREDYAKKLLIGIRYCQSAIQEAAYYLLDRPQVLDQVREDIFFSVDDIWRHHDEIPSRMTVTLDVMAPSRKIVLYNALAMDRHEVLTVIVNTPYVVVRNIEGNEVKCQVAPVISGGKRFGIAYNKYQVSFLVSVPAMALTTYSIHLGDATQKNSATTFTKVTIYNADYWNVELPKDFPVEQPTARLNDDISMADLTLQAGTSTRALVTNNGLLKAIVGRDWTVTPVHMDFVKYDTLKEHDNNSGAYLFIPSGPAVPMRPEPFPEIVILEGPIKTVMYAALNEPEVAEVMLTISVSNNPTQPQSEVEITNTVLINENIDNLELAMRLLTSIKNGNEFFTDLNGMQMIKRRTLNKLPLQANFYPLPAAAYIQDSDSRLTLLTSTPLGMAALKPGQIEVMQDRRLSRDDNRGMDQGVLDNVRTRHTFRVIIEKINKDCQQKISPEHPSGQLSIAGHVSYNTLLQPLIVLQYTSQDPNKQSTRAGSNPVSFNNEHLQNSPPVDVSVTSYRTHLLGKTREGSIIQGSGVIFHRTYLDLCYGNQTIQQWYPLGDGKINPSEYIKLRRNEELFESSLTFVNIGSRVSGSLTLCPMGVKSLFINQTMSAKQRLGNKIYHQDDKTTNHIV